MIKEQPKLIVRKASAGAGKTFTLVKEYLKLAFSGSEKDLETQFQHILAITFTNKAANEMKVRIMKELDEIAAKGEGSDMAKQIHKETGLPYAKLTEYATRVKSAILHHYSDLSVCTIDSFMHRIVKTFAHDLNLPVNFDVVLEDSDLIQTSVDELMALAGTSGNEELTDMLVAFADDKMEEGKSYDVSKQISDLAGEIFKEGTAEKLEKLENITFADFQNIQKEMRDANRDWENEVKKLGKEGDDIITNSGISRDCFYYKDRGIAGYFKKVAGGNFAPGNSYVDKFLSKKNLTTSGVSKTDAAAVEALHEPLAKKYKEIQDYVAAGISKYNTRNALLRNLFSMAVLNQLNQIVTEESHNNDMIHISEFNKQISSVVQGEPMPFIYERVGSKYRYVLIDEFQDTSRQQWQNLLPLVDNAVSSGHTGLIVGDGKQAIYRFRKGDVKQFVDLPAVESEFHGGLFLDESVADVKNMLENYRTRREVVEFNNRFYEWIVKHALAVDDESKEKDKNLLLKKIYLGPDYAETGVPELRQNVTKEGGYVQLEFLDTKSNGNEAIYDAILKDIRHQVDDLGYRYSDIIILGRDKKVLSEVSQHLNSNADGKGAVPMLSSESFLLKNSKVVALLRAILYYLLDNRDRVAATQALQLLRELGITQKRDYTQDLLTDNEDRLVDLGAILEHDGITFDSAKLRSLTLYDCCEELIRTLSLEGIETHYTSSMLNVVAAYSKNHRQDLAEFLEWFDKKLDKLASNSAGAQDAITLMTIHKAKGLESKIVMYAVPSATTKANSIWVDLDEGDFKIPTSLVTPKKDEKTDFKEQSDEEAEMSVMDEINVLYVATTRPKSKLMIYSATPSSNSSAAAAYPQLFMGYACLDKSDPLATQWENPDRDGRDLYTVGEDKHFEDKDEELLPNEVVSQLKYPTWTDRVEIARQADKIFNTSSLERIQQGIVIHEILAMMQSADDVEDAVERYTSENGTDPQKRHDLQQQIAYLMKQPDCARFFDPKYQALNECDIVMDYEDKDGNTVRGVRRPDRIVLAGDETWVVDFKTGKPNKEYEKQVRCYCRAVEQMGYPNVKGFLLFVGNGRCHVEEI